MTVDERIASLPDAVRDLLLDALDELSRPMTVRQIDHALAPHFSRSQRKPIIRALAAIHVIALVPKG